MNKTQKKSPFNMPRFLLLFLSFFIYIQRTKASSLSSSVVAYYPFDGDANDASGNGNHGTVYGVLPATDRFGISSNCYNFTGKNAYIEVTQGRDFSFTNEMSISFWLKPSSAQVDFGGIFDKTHMNYTGWVVQQLATLTDAFYFAYVGSPNAVAIASSSSLPSAPHIQTLPNAWNHLVITKKNATVKYYINGTLATIENTTFSEIDANLNTPLVIGGINGGASSPASLLQRFYIGLMDEVYFLNRDVNSEEVLQLFTYRYLPSPMPTTPTRNPSALPTSQPSGQPTSQPSEQPTSQPSGQPTSQPSGQPTSHPSEQPTSQPSEQPTSQPSGQPTSQPSDIPTSKPSEQPTSQPSGQPTSQPSELPTSHPSEQPTSQPSELPTSQPSGQPTSQPSEQPTSQPSEQPTSQPSGQPTSQPSGQPTSQPSELPTSHPSEQPTSQPSEQPTSQPSGQPTSQPSEQPTSQPSGQPTSQPSGQPTSQPSEQPTSQPSGQPTSQPSGQPTSQPSGQPTSQPSEQPTSQPSDIPTSKPSGQPSDAPSPTPTTFPTLASAAPTVYNPSNSTIAIWLNNTVNTMSNTNTTAIFCGGAPAFCFTTATINGQVRASYELSVDSIEQVYINSKYAFMQSTYKNQTALIQIDYKKGKIINAKLAPMNLAQTISMDSDQVLTYGTDSLQRLTVKRFNQNLDELVWSNTYSLQLDEIIDTSENFILGYANNKNLVCKLRSDGSVELCFDMISYYGSNPLYRSNSLNKATRLASHNQWGRPFICASSRTSTGQTNGVILGLLNYEMQGQKDTLTMDAVYFNQAEYALGSYGNDCIYVFKASTIGLGHQHVMFCAEENIFCPTIAVLNNMIGIVCNSMSTQSFSTHMLDPNTLRGDLKPTFTQFFDQPTNITINDRFTALLRFVSTYLVSSNMENDYKNFTDIDISPYTIEQYLPANVPSHKPSQKPTTQTPSSGPTAEPSTSSTSKPSMHPQPSSMPSSSAPAMTYRPSFRSTVSPSLMPTLNPSIAPSFMLTLFSTWFPTFSPTSSPTFALTNRPTTQVPSPMPTIRPSSQRPTRKVDFPTYSPTLLATTKSTDSHQNSSTVYSYIELALIIGLPTGTLFGILFLLMKYKNRDDRYILGDSLCCVRRSEQVYPNPEQTRITIVVQRPQELSENSSISSHPSWLSYNFEECLDAVDDLSSHDFHSDEQRSVAGVGEENQNLLGDVLQVSSCLDLPSCEIRDASIVGNDVDNGVSQISMVSFVPHVNESESEKDEENLEDGISPNNLGGDDRSEDDMSDFSYEWEKSPQAKAHQVFSFFSSQSNNASENINSQVAAISHFSNPSSTK